MTTIGYATLAIIPSLEGVSKSIDKQLEGPLRASGKQGGKALAKGVGEGLKDLEQSVDSASKAYGRLKDKASDALGKVRSDEAALQRLRDTGASNDRVIRAEERLATSRRNSARANREAEDGHRSLASAQSALADSSGNLGQNLTGLAGIASRLGPALATAAGVAGGAAVAGLALLAGAAVTASKALYELGSTFDDAFDNIRVKTGATGPELAELEQATKRVAATVPESIGTIANVTAEVSRSLRLTGTDLDNVTKAVATLGRLTGEDVDVRTLGKAFRGFGVDAKDQVPALDSLFQASQTTGIGVNELLATVVKGGPALRQFGFDFGESSALLTQFEDAGLDAEKVVPGLTKGLAALAKDGKTGKQALTDYVTQIKALLATGKDAEALDLTNKLFGAKGGVQFFEAIKNGALDLDALQHGINGTGDTIAQAAEDTDDWAEKWATFKNKVQVALQPLASGVFDIVNEQLEGFADAVSKHQPEIIGFFTDIGAVAATSFGAALKGIGLFTEGLGQMVGGLGNVVGALKDASAWQEDLFGNHDRANQLRREAQEAYGWGEGLQNVGKGMQDAAGKISALNPKIREYGEAAQEASKFTTALGETTAALPDGKTITISDNSPETVERLHKLGIEVQQTPKGITVTATTDEAKRILDAFRAQQSNSAITPVVKPDLTQANSDMQSFLNQWSKAIVAPPAPAPATPPVPSLLDPNRPTFGHATGGAIFGAGTATSDSIPALLSNGEHVLTAKDVGAMGGQPGVYSFRNALHRAGGGAVGPDVRAAGDLVGTPYSQAGRYDCSGMPARVIDRVLGLPENGLMSTKNAAEWLAARGFKQGLGGPGQISVGWYDHGPNPNDGHMSMTLSDGRNAEAGGSVGVFTIGGGAAGASSPQFDHHMFLPTVYGEGVAGAAGAPGAPAVGGSSGGGGGAPSPVGGGSSGGGGGGSLSIPSSLSGFGSFAGQQIGNQLGNLAGPGAGDLGALGSAAGSVIDGQVSSALDVFGVPSTPGWLKGVSSLIGGISIGGGGGGAAMPLASSPTTTGTTPPDNAGNMNGAKQLSQPGVTYNITARDTEDAFIRAQRLEKEKAAAKVARF
jgi:TP901 family phage tail tape measure protein